MINIAALITCHNRKDKTLSCLSALYSTLDVYNQNAKEQLDLSVYITDDGCTDGTFEAIANQFNDKNIFVQKGDGNLFWAGGMRVAWNAALSAQTKWDYYLLLNDDTDILPNLFDELFATRDYSIKHYGKEGLISGITSSKSDYTTITYGGDVWVNKFTGKLKRIIPNGEPIMVDFTNANILLVHKSVVEKIGIFYKGFRHGNADYDYSSHAKKAGFPVLLTGQVCGRCDDDHRNVDEEKRHVLSMTSSQRKAYFSNPIHSSADYLKFIRRNTLMRYPLVAIGRFLNERFPKLYYCLNDLK